MNENSIIINIGGYQGNWIGQIIKYNPFVYIFEPVKSFYNNLTEKFKHNPKIKIFNYGILDKNKEEIIYVNRDRTSLFYNYQSGPSELVKIRDFKDVLNELHITKAHMLELNAEGAEYVIMPYIIDNNIINIFDCVRVQFHHGYYDRSYEIMNDVFKKLENKKFTLVENTEDWKEWRKNE